MATPSELIPIISKGEKFCTPCKKTGKVAAQYYCTECESYYCETCFELHTRIPLLTKHVVRKCNDVDMWANLPYKCRTHDKPCEFFCGKHETLCCHVCVSLQHTTCFDMEYNLMKAKDIFNKTEFLKMKQDMRQDMDQIQKMKKEFEKRKKVNKCTCMCSIV